MPRAKGRSEAKWKAIPNYEGLYEVSDTGRVRSLDRVRISTSPIEKAWIKGAEKALSERVGYYYVQLYKDGFCKNYRVHRLVAIAFIQNPHKKAEVNHKDGDKLNNHLSNLEWMTRSENDLHAYRTGLRLPCDVHGIKNPNAKLNEKQVKVIKHLKNIQPRMTQTEIGNIFNVTYTNIGDIWSGKRWGHITI